MTATKEVTIWCDGPDCLRWTYGAGVSRTAKEARWGARLKGWVHRNGKDLCPYCKERTL